LKLAKIGALKSPKSCSAFVAVGLDIETNQKQHRNRNEQKGGEEAEVVCFHGRKGLQMEGITRQLPKLLSGKASSSGVAAKVLFPTAESSSSGASESSHWLPFKTIAALVPPPNEPCH
jgi:hypothetical protein